MNHRPAPSNRTRHATNAFTIIELVVAMAIASIMIFLINRIFFDTTNAVSRGIGLSQIIGESRAFSSTLATDISSETATPVVPPNQGGFLFIGFKTYNDIDFANPRRLNGTAIQHDVQSDQLLTVIDITDQGRTPLTPMNDDTFSPYPSTATHGLLWYGHVSRLNASNINPTVTGGSDAGELTDGNNRFGHQWVLGRQLMFLDPMVPATVAHVNGAYARDFVTGYSIPSGITPQTRWMALSDILNISLADITSPSATSVLESTVLTNIQYLARVAQMAYVTERLRVASSPSAAPTLFESWNLAQTHPAFMSNCSDFQISFAGDFDNATNPGIDIEDDWIGSGTPTNPEYRGGNIKWYGYPPNNPFVPGYDNSRPAVYEPNPTIPAAAATNFNGSATGDPIVVSGTALLAEINTQISPDSIADVQVDHAIVFKHDATDKATQWPHLIRIRYRLHDERGEIESTNGLNRGEQGIWFEQIIRVQ